MAKLNLLQITSEINASEGGPALLPPPGRSPVGLRKLHEIVQREAGEALHGLPANTLGAGLNAHFEEVAGVGLQYGRATVRGPAAADVCREAGRIGRWLAAMGPMTRRVGAVGAERGYCSPYARAGRVLEACLSGRSPGGAESTLRRSVGVAGRLLGRPLKVEDTSLPEGWAWMHPRRLGFIIAARRRGVVCSTYRQAREGLAVWAAAAAILAPKGVRPLRHAIPAQASESPEAWAAATLATEAARVTAVAHVFRVPRSFAESVRWEDAESVLPMRQRLMKAWRRMGANLGEAERPHAWAALLQIFASFTGENLQRALGMAERHGLHDVGSELRAGALSEEAQKWALRQERWPDAAKVGSAFQYLLDAGWNPEAAGSAGAALEKLAARSFDGARSVAFAKAAAVAKAHPQTYGGHEARWMRDLSRRDSCTVPSPRSLSAGRFVLSRVDSDDPAALWAGAYVGCCQHPDGAGDSSAWHAATDVDGAIWAVSSGGRMVAQAWVWRSGDTLVLDNIEAGVLGNSEHLTTVRELFRVAAAEVVARRALGVARVLCGMGYMSKPLRFEEPASDTPEPPYGVYTDARRGMWKVAA